MTSDLQARLEQALASNAALVAALHRACSGCNGTRKRRTSCTFCGDSTYDHDCNDEEVSCTNPVHVLADKPHHGAALLREVLALRRVRKAIGPWERAIGGPSITHDADKQELLAALQEADKAREKP